MEEDGREGRTARLIDRERQRDSQGVKREREETDIYREKRQIYIERASQRQGGEREETDIERERERPAKRTPLLLSHATHASRSSIHRPMWFRLGMCTCP